MQLRIIVGCIVLCFLISGAKAQTVIQSTVPPQQSQSQSAPTARGSVQQPADTAKIDPAKEADIRKLIAIESGTDDMQKQVDENLQNIVRPQLVATLPPGDYREKLVDLFLAKASTTFNMSQMVQQLIPIYDKYLTDDQVKALIAFYMTPEGRKICLILPNMMADIHSFGDKFMNDASRKAMVEVLQENPDLAKALDDARKKAGGQ